MTPRAPACPRKRPRQVSVAGSEDPVGMARRVAPGLEAAGRPLVCPVSLTGKSATKSNQWCDASGKLRLESSGLRQSRGYARPRLPNILLLAPVVVRALSESSPPGQSRELPFRISTAFPVVSIHHGVVWGHGSKHPRFDVPARRAQHYPWMVLGLAQPVQNDSSQGVGGAAWRWAGLLTRQVVVRSVAYVSTRVCLSRHVRVRVHDQHVVIHEYRRAGHGTAAFRGRLAAPSEDPYPSDSRFSGWRRGKGGGSLRLQGLEFKLGVRQQGIQDCLEHDGVAWSFDRRGDT